MVFVGVGGTQSDSDTEEPLFPEDREMDKTERWTASKKQWPEEDPSGPVSQGAEDCPRMGGEGRREKRRWLPGPGAWVSAIWCHLP